MTGINISSHLHSDALATVSFGGADGTELVGSGNAPSFGQLLQRASNDNDSPNTKAGDNELAKKFEASVLATLLQPMFENLGAEPPFGGGQQESVMRSFLVQEYAALLAEQQSFGFGKAVVDEINRNNSPEP